MYLRIHFGSTYWYFGTVSLIYLSVSADTLCLQLRINYGKRHMVSGCDRDLALAITHSQINHLSHCVERYEATDLVLDMGVSRSPRISRAWTCPP